MEVASKVQHTFSVSLNWDIVENKAIVNSGKRIPLVVTPPPEFGGADSEWSPEHLLAASLTSCYATTFFYFARLFKIKVKNFSLEAEMEVEKDDQGPFSTTRFILHPQIEFGGNVSNELVTKILEKTKKYCIITNSVKAQEVIDAKIQTVGTKITVLPK
jgi:organic hydroperoxide reductase OsmC/OhrA